MFSKVLKKIVHKQQKGRFELSYYEMSESMQYYIFKTFYTKKLGIVLLECSPYSKDFFFIIKHSNNTMRYCSHICFVIVIQHMKITALLFLLYQIIFDYLVLQPFIPQKQRFIRIYIQNFNRTSNFLLFIYNILSVMIMKPCNQLNFCLDNISFYFSFFFFVLPSFCYLSLSLFCYWYIFTSLTLEKLLKHFTILVLPLKFSLINHLEMRKQS